ncbi:MAG: hypothetical protein GC193_13170 [Cryomorphaceae bacterium]|nr:hypothetical protein [Cryomorphaceae bacterium]
MSVDRKKIAIVCQVFGVSQSLVMSKSRKQEATFARFVYWNLKRKRGHTFSELGRELGRTHASVLHGVREADHLAKTNPQFRAKYQLCEAAFNTTLTRHRSSVRIRRAGSTPLDQICDLAKKLHTLLPKEHPISDALLRLANSNRAI